MAKVWSDSPLTTKDNDAFGRAEYAIRATRLIASSHSWDESVVFGLTGEWGSGKTSMLAMITEELSESYSNWKIARFTPWATGDVSGLLGEFYASLSDALPRDRGKEARSALGTLSRVTAPAANLVPVVGGAAEAAARAVGDALRQRTPWDKAFNDASSKLRKLQTPVLMIADDIDRLQTDELLALLRVVRLLGRFGGVHYLLAYDEATLFQSLSGAKLVGEDRGTAAQFMEKIVQYPLFVPPLLPTQLLRRLDAGVDAALLNAGRPALRSRRLGDLEDVFKSALPTPRAIDRYTAQLRHHLPLLPADEIDDEDVILLTLLRTAFPTVYSQLPTYRKQLISGVTDEMKKGTSGVEFQEFDSAPLFRSLSPDARPMARGLLYTLFPNLRPSGHIGHSSRTGQRICTDAYFDRYFAMGIPSHDISDAEVAKVVQDAARGESSGLARLLTHPDRDRLDLVITKAIATSAELGEQFSFDEGRLHLISAIAKFVDLVPSGQGFFLSPRERLLRWAGVLLGGLSTTVSAERAFNAIEAVPRLADRISVAYTAGREHDHGSPPNFMPQVTALIASQVADAFIENLRLRDEAPLTEGIGWFTSFLASTRSNADVRARVQSAIDSDEFAIEDLAARFVATPVIIGGDAGPQLDDPDQALYDAIAPARDDEWYAFTRAPEIDLHDLSWRNRRAYVRGRLRRPSMTD